MSVFIISHTVTMLVGQAQKNILTDLSKELLIYRIFILFPFEIVRNNQLVTTWRVRLYMCIMLLVYGTLRLFFLLENFDSALQFVLSSGKIWMFITIFDLVFSVISFVGILLNGLITNIHQIEFYQELQSFDMMLSANFGVFVKRSRTRGVNNCVLITNIVYNIFLFMSLFISGHMILNPYQQFAYLFTYYFSNNISILSAHMFVNCVQLCRERIQIVRKLLRNQNPCSMDNMEIVLQLYSRICKQIRLINSFMGLVVLLKVTRDFTLGSSIMYLMCTSFDKMEISGFAHILWIFSLGVFGTLLMAFIAEKLMTEVTLARILC